jgi:hypothetical protein
VALDFGASLDHSPQSENLRELGEEVLDFEGQDSVAAAVVIPPRAKTLLEEGWFAAIFWEVVGGGAFLLGFLAKTGGWTWFFGGEVVVDCW